LNGNIKSLSRSGYVHDGISMDPIKGLIDDLTLEYRGNRLVKVSDNVGEETVLTSNDFKDVSNVNISDEYLYDACGNATADLNRGIAWVKYNCLHLPTTIQFSNGNKSSYAYDARGMKRSVQHAFSLSGIQIPFGADTVENTQSIQSFSQTDYCGNFIYEDGQLSRILTPEGYIETTDYYPFGLEISTPEGLLTSGNNPYLYNGKELDRMHGLNMYDYGARFYDAALGRFTTVDPLAGNHYNFSPFHYVLNNPILFIDLFGMDTTVYILDQQNKPDNKRIYTADVYVVVDGEISGPYERSSFPNNDTRHNTLNTGEYSYNNKYGHNAGAQKGLNIVDEKGERVAPGTAPDGSEVEMTEVNVHSGVSSDDDPTGLGRENRGSAGCPTIKPCDSENFFSNFDWSGSNQTTGTSRGTISIQRGGRAHGTKSYLHTMQSMQRVFKKPGAKTKIPQRN